MRYLFKPWTRGCKAIVLSVMIVLAVTNYKHYSAIDTVDSVISLGLHLQCQRVPGNDFHCLT